MTSRNSRPLAKAGAADLEMTKGQVDIVQAALRGALLAGRSTTDIRVRLAASTANVEAAEVRLAETIAEQDQIAATEVSLAVDLIEQEVACRFQDLKTVITPAAYPTLSQESSDMLTIPPAVATHARAMAEAEREYHKAATALSAAEAARGLIDTRIADLMAQRNAITSRRGSGTHQPDDGSLLALAVADRESIDAMIPDADAVVDAARRPAERLRHAVGHARTRLAHAEAEAVEAALIEHVRELDKCLLEAVERLTAQGGVLQRRRPQWGPTPGLYDALRTLQAKLGKL